MRAVVQRVSEASVSVGDVVSGRIGRGFLVLIGVKADDEEADSDYVADKISGLRVFEDENGKMNLSLLDVGGHALIVSQFTLYGDCRKGRRPSFTESASGEHAESHYSTVCRKVSERGIPVETGVFGAMMKVRLVNDGPVTILLDSRRAF